MLRPRSKLAFVHNLANFDHHLTTVERHGSPGADPRGRTLTEAEGDEFPIRSEGTTLISLRDHPVRRAGGCDVAEARIAVDGENGGRHVRPSCQPRVAAG